MAKTSKNIVPPKQVRVRMTELAEEAGQGGENILLTLLQEAAHGWDDVEAGELLSVPDLKARYGHPGRA